MACAMTAPSPVDSTVVIGPWRQSRPVDHRAALVAQIETLERRQVGRHAAVDELSALIERKELEIENLRGQLQ